MKKEVIELKAVSFGYGFHFKLLDDKTGFAHENIIEGQPCTYKIEDYKLLQFWKKIDALGVWNWQKNILIGSKNLFLYLMVVIGN